MTIIYLLKKVVTDLINKNWAGENGFKRKNQVIEFNLTVGRP